MNVTTIEKSILIRGPIDCVWRELTKTDSPQKAVYNCMFYVHSLEPGSRCQFRTANQENVIAVGKIVSCETNQKFSHTFKFTQYEEPECTISYYMRKEAAGVSLTTIVDDLILDTKTLKELEGGVTFIQNNLKSIVESGRPPFLTRVIYQVFSKMQFVLPRKTKAKFWPV